MPRRARLRSLVAAVTVIVAAAALGGCGLGAGQGTSEVSLLVTRDFGSRAVGRLTEHRVPGSETVMRLLERHFRTTTRYGGGFVESIDGLSGTSDRRDWFFYVNGIEAQRGAAAISVHRGDRIWWDLHDWTATDSVPAVVGQFPEPFTTGTGGRRLPTVLSCATDAAGPCAAVGHALSAAHVPFADQFLGTGSGADSLAIVVGTWRDLRGLLAAALVQAGPAKSGVYGRFAGPGGGALELEDPKGQVVRTLTGSAGLVAATEQPSVGDPTWLVTGTDPAGVMAAARALRPAILAGHFAVAVAGGRYIPLPVQPGT